MSLFARSYLKGLTIGLLVPTITFAVPTRAFAQANEAIAEALFDEGKQLFAAGNFEKACPKLAQSYQADPAGGTLLLLAMCYENQGLTASAWAKYAEALALARRDGRTDREQRARERMAALQPRLSYIKLSLATEELRHESPHIEIDGLAIPFLTDTPIPLDPGKHALTIKASGYREFHQDFEVQGEGQTGTIVIPALEPLPKTPQATPIAPVVNTSTTTLDTGSHRGNTQRTVAWIVGGAGLVATAAGSYFGIRAIQLNHDADNACSGSTCIASDPRAAQAVNDSQDANTNARRANVFIGAGAMTLAAAAVLWFTAPRNHRPSTTAHALVLPGTAAVGVSGSF